MKPIEWLLAAVLSCTAAIAAAQVPRTINYQGMLKTAAGLAVDSPSALGMTFSLYATPTGGAALWSETQNVSVANGVFDVILGTGVFAGGAPLAGLPFDAPYYLEVAVAGELLSPRSVLSATPYAFRAIAADSLAAAATVAGAQITGSITTATIPAAQVIGGTGNGTVFMYNGVGGDQDQLSPNGSTHNGGANALQSQSPMPFACTAGSFYVWAPKGPTVITTYTLLKEGLPTGITCSLPVTTAAVSCTDLVDTAAIAAGDRISTLVGGGAGAGTTVSISWRCR
jgi:hypothetical protein